LGARWGLCRHGAGAIFVDHTTVSARVTRELAAQAAESGLGFVDAPVSGGQAGAENGQLSIMCGGTEAIMPGPSR
jgi:3-hydroxyisobutyrate dehydrogenase